MNLMHKENLIFSNGDSFLRICSSCFRTATVLEKLLLLGKHFFRAVTSSAFLDRTVIISEQLLLSELQFFQNIQFFAAATAETMKFFIKDLFSKCDQIHSILWIGLHLLNKSLMENFIFCVVSYFFGLSTFSERNFYWTIISSE